MKFESDLLCFRPLYQERVWGGTELQRVWARAVPENRLIGESWEVVDRPGAQSIVASGRYEGRTLRNLLEEYSAAIMGPGWKPQDPFPILVKWLDCCDRLSLQVHPPAARAADLGGEPKTENWFIAAAGPGAELLVGLAEGVTRVDFERAAAAGNLQGLVRTLPVVAGQSVLIPSGQVHAIGAGTLILEIQQNSDTTYRVDDWGRVGLDGKPRELHLAAALASIEWDRPAPQLLPVASGDRILADGPEFRLQQFVRGAGDRIIFPPRSGPRILSLVTGALEILDGHGRPLHRLRAGDNALVPYDAACHARVEENSVFLVTDGFTHVQRI